VASRNGTLEDLRFLTQKGADVFDRDTTINSAVHFHAVAYNVDIIKLLLGVKVC
jgi:ankyrin repeat protein